MAMGPPFKKAKTDGASSSHGPEGGLAPKGRDEVRRCVLQFHRGALFCVVVFRCRAKASFACRPPVRNTSAPGSLPAKKNMVANTWVECPQGRKLEKSWVDLAKVCVDIESFPNRPLLMLSPCCGLDTPLLALVDLGVRCKSMAWEVDGHLKDAVAYRANCV